MTSTVLVEHRWLATTVLVVVVATTPLVAAVLADRPRLLWTLTVGALLPVATLTLVPVDRELVARCEVAWSLPTPGRVELAANVALFVAPVVLAGVALGRPVVALLAGSALSVGIEGLQAVAPALGRSCSTNDWAANTFGAAIGAALAWIVLRVVRRRDRSLRSPAPIA